MKAVLMEKQLLAAQSLAGSFTSTPSQVIESDVAGIQVNYSGSPVGSIEVQISADYNPQLQTGNWVSLPFTIAGVTGTTVAIPGNASPVYFDIYGCSMPWVRIKYTASSGTGSMDAFLTYKRLGD